MGFGLQEVLRGDDVLMARDALRELFRPIHIVEDENGAWAEIAANQTVMLKARLAYGIGSEDWI